MRKIEGTPRSLHYVDGQPFAKIDVQVSTAAELPELGEIVEGIGTDPGSNAQIIQSGDWATLDADGSWYDKDGNEVN